MSLNTNTKHHIPSSFYARKITSFTYIFPLISHEHDTQEYWTNCSVLECSELIFDYLQF